MKRATLHKHLGIFRDLLLPLLFLLSCSSVVVGQSLDIQRSVEKSGEKQYLVKVKVQKRNVEGYAKLEELIPEGFVAYERETRSANFIFKDGKAKFIWMDIPDENEFEVRYRLIQKQDEAGTYTIEGRLSCVSGNDLLRTRNSNSFSTQVSEELAGGHENGKEEDPATEGPGEKVAKEEELGRKEGKGRSSGSEEESPDKGTPEDRTKESEEAEKAKRIDKTKSVGPGRSFSVQIGAFKEPKEENFFANEYGVDEQELRTFRSGGLHKYSIGSFKTYEDAEKKKEDLRSKGVKAFIIGVREGELVRVSSLLE